MPHVGLDLYFIGAKHQTGLNKAKLVPWTPIDAGLLVFCWHTSASDALSNGIKYVVLVWMCWSLAPTLSLLNISGKSWSFRFSF